MADWKTPWANRYKQKEGVDWVHDDNFDVDAWNVKHGFVGEQAEQGGLDFNAYKTGLGQQKIYDQNKQKLAAEQGNRQQGLVNENALSQKYLNQSLKQRGLAGNGVGGTTAELSLRNTLMNNMGAVNANIGSRQSAMDLQKTEFDNNLYNSYYGTGGQRDKIAKDYVLFREQAFQNALASPDTDELHAPLKNLYDYNTTYDYSTLDGINTAKKDMTLAEKYLENAINNKTYNKEVNEELKKRLAMWNEQIVAEMLREQKEEEWERTLGFPINPVKPSGSGGGRAW